jgi:hypothetical protein
MLSGDKVRCPAAADPGGGQIVDSARFAQDLAVWAGDDLQVHALATVLAS